jgi:hypothetical protein
LKARAIAVLVVVLSIAGSAAAADDTTGQLEIHRGQGGLAVLIGGITTHGVDWSSSQVSLILLREAPGPTRFDDLDPELLRKGQSISAIAEQRGAQVLGGALASQLVRDVAVCRGGAWVVLEAPDGLVGAVGLWLGADGEARHVGLREVVEATLPEADGQALRDRLSSRPRFGRIVQPAGTTPDGDGAVVVQRVEGIWLAYHVSEAGRRLQASTVEQVCDALPSTESQDFVESVIGWVQDRPDDLARVAQASLPILCDPARPVGLRTLLLPYASSFEGVPADALAWGLREAGYRDDAVARAGLLAAATTAPIEWVNAALPRLLDNIDSGVPSMRVNWLGAVLRRLEPERLDFRLRLLLARHEFSDSVSRMLQALQDPTWPPELSSYWGEFRRDREAWFAAEAGCWEEAAQVFAEPRVRTIGGPRWSPLLPLLGKLPALPGDPHRERLASVVRAALEDPGTQLAGCSAGWIEWLRFAWS